MLFRLTAPVAELAQLPRTQLSSILADLLNAHRSGRHLVVIPRQTAEWIATDVELSPRERATIDRIGQEYTQTANLPERAAWFVELFLFTRPTVPATNRFELSLRSEWLAEALERSVLLVEDEAIDGELFQSILQTNCRRLGVDNISFEPRHGGGDRMPAVLARLAPTGRIAVAVIDSDQSSPHCPPSTKHRALQDVVDQNADKIVRLSCLPCREAENLLSIDILDSLYGPSHLASVAYLRSIDSGEKNAQIECRDRFFLFFDIKKGLSKNSIDQISHPPSREWVEQRLSAMGADAEVVAGFGDRVVRQTLAKGECIGELRRLVTSAEWLQVFGAFFAEIAWITTAARPRLT